MSPRRRMTGSAKAFRDAAELAAERPDAMLSEADQQSVLRARALAASSAGELKEDKTKASAVGFREGGGAPNRAAARSPPLAGRLSPWDVGTAAWDNDEDSRMKVGSAGDHFALAAHHTRQGIMMLLSSCYREPPPSPGGSSPVVKRSSGTVPGSPDAGGQAIDDDDEDEEEQMKRIVREAGVIIPTDPWKERWDVLILVMIIYSAIVVPYRICFESPASGLMWVFEQILTLVFIVDVVFNFNTAHSDNAETWVVDRREIACRYLSGWFWIDVPSCVPVELLDLVLEGEQKQMGLLRFLRLFRLIRLLRLLKVGEYVANLEEKFDINLTFLRIATMLLKLVFLSHILACFWFYVALLHGLNEETVTWVSEYDEGSGLHADAHIQYLYSMYWALTTLTTVR